MALNIQISRKISSAKSYRELMKLFVRFESKDSKNCDDSKSNAGSKNIGFIGLGNMGYHMSGHLIKKGHKLHVNDISKEAMEKLKAKGATLHDNIEQLAAASDFVFTMLPDNPIVLDVYTKMTAKGANKNAMYIDSSTIDPSLAKDLRTMLGEKGATFIDAPVSGGVPGAENATLTFMVGGKKEEFEKVKPILECMGKNIMHMGDIGMGQAAKICNNMMLGIAMIGVCETMNLAIRLGLDAKHFADMMNSSTGRCWSSDTYNPVPGVIPNSVASKGYGGGFTVGLITKDLSLASNVAIGSDTPIQLGAAAHQIYRHAKNKGYGKCDFTVIYDILKNEENY